jgi:hypothetical protein
LRNAGSGNLTVAPSGGDVINGSGTIDLAPTDSCFVCCSGTAFFTVGLGKSTQFNFTQLTKAVTTGSVTLTATEASNVIQKYTGTLSGNVTVTIPQVIQIYYITNQTDGTGAGYDISFTTGVSVEPLMRPFQPVSRLFLLCDSVNIFNASTVAAGASTLAAVEWHGGYAIAELCGSEGNTGVYRPCL